MNTQRNAFETLKARVDCTQLMEALGARRFKEGRYSAPWREASDSGSVEVHADRFYDHVEKAGGSCLDLVMRVHGLSLQDAAEWLARWAGIPWETRYAIAKDANAGPVSRETDAPQAKAAGPGPDAAVAPPSAKGGPPGKRPVEVAAYSYVDEAGKCLYQAVRYEPGENGRSKTFRQRRPDGNGGWTWNMDGARLVPYNLPAVKEAESVWVVEGEKDADSLTLLGEVATTNIGGAGKWLPAYSEYLRGKEVVLCGDNDEPGQKHMAKVLETMAGIAGVVIVGRVPEPYKDITDYLNDLNANEKAGALDEIRRTGKRLLRGVDLPVSSIEDMERSYIAELERLRREQSQVDLAAWLPSFRHHVRRLVPGEVVTVVADTGVGKSMVLQNVTMAVKAPTLFFELELPESLMFERLAAMALGMPAGQVEADYSIGRRYQIKGLDHVFVCSSSGLTVDEMLDVTRKAELKMGVRPAVVMIDYVQIVAGGFGKRYERTSDVAERLKVFAKQTETVVFVASQVGRKEEPEIHLHDAKDSGSIENSSGLVLGLWRDPGNADRLWVKVLKNTKGRAGHKVACRIDGPRLRITEDVQQQAPATQPEVSRLPYGERDDI